MDKISQILIGASIIIGAGLVATARATPSIASPYALCTYKGNITFSSSLLGWEASCWLTFVTKISCEVDTSDNHHFHVVAAGTMPGQGTICTAFTTGGFPWGGDMTAGGGVVGGQLDTAHNLLGLPSLGSFNPGSLTWAPIAFGVITSITGSNPTPSPCAGGHQVPQTISVSSGGSLNFGGVARIDTLGPDHILLRSCVIQ